MPIFVLAGTIVKGGNPKQTSPVDAFCVEHGRWNGNRDGRATAGHFGTSEVLATSKVRAAGLEAGRLAPEAREQRLHGQMTENENERPRASVDPRACGALASA